MGSWMDDRGPADASRMAPEPDAGLRSLNWGDADDRRAPAAAPGDGREFDGTQALLARAVQCEIIPRLMKSHEQSPGAPGHARARAPLSSDDIHDFARCVLDQDPPFAQARLESLQARGLSLDQIYLDVLEPVAQLMGRWWVEDALSFTDVTVGLGRLQQLMREVGARNETERPVAGRRVLLLATPGEQHTFGLSMVAELFAHAGWDVCGDPVDGAGDPLRRVREEWFDVVGFTLGTLEQIEPVRALVAQVRAHSRNPAVGIMVGGSAVARVPQCADRLDADGVALDGREAVALAGRLAAGEGEVS